MVMANMVALPASAPDNIDLDQWFSSIRCGACALLSLVFQPPAAIK